MTGEWWVGLAPVEVVVPCDGDEHRVRWREGVLQLLDHPAGAEPAVDGTCGLVRDAWVRRQADVRALAFATRGRSDPLGRRAGAAAHLRVTGRDDTPSSATGRSDPATWFAAAADRRDDLADGEVERLETLALCLLGDPLARRLAASVVAARLDRLDVLDVLDAHTDAALVAGLWGRVACTVREWLADAAVDVALTVVEADAPRRLERHGTTVEVSVPHRWLIDVWAHGLETFAGELVLDARHRPDELVLDVVDTDLTTRRLTVRTGPAPGPASGEASGSTVDLWPWWSALAPATAWVPCGAGDHRLVWTCGELSAPDHVADDAGDSCPRALSAWQPHRHDRRLLVLGPRGPADLLRPAAPDPVDEPFGADDGGPRPLGVVDLLRLGGGLAQRLVAGAAAEWAARLDGADTDAGHDHEELRAALYGRVLTAVHEWQGDPSWRVHLDLVPAGVTRRIELEGRTARVALPFRWLVDVWAPGMATVLDTFVLSRSTAGDGTNRLGAVDTAGATCWIVISS